MLLRLRGLYSWSKISHPVYGRAYSHIQEVCGVGPPASIPLPTPPPKLAQPFWSCLTGQGGKGSDPLGQSLGSLATVCLLQNLLFPRDQNLIIQQALGAKESVSRIRGQWTDFPSQGAVGQLSSCSWLLFHFPIPKIMCSNCRKLGEKIQIIHILLPRNNHC